MKEQVRASTSAGTQTTDLSEPAPPKETIVTAPPVDSPTTSPTFHITTGKPPPRKVLRLKCPHCDDYPDGFRSEHELRRHSNRVHRKTRKVWVTIDTSPDKSFLANCKACQTGKRYNECYNAASHLRRMHFHPHKRGERKMSAAEARRGGKPGDLDPPMDVLKAHWLREVDESFGDADEQSAGGSGSPVASDQAERTAQDKTDASKVQLPSQPTANQPEKPEGRAPPTPTTPSTRSMAIDSIVDKVDAA
ncbi:hypothetical protein K458DRAFT_411456 [Lentithecium fluviatile CBS 122367]|uniref:DUF7896 domain-containing protein n=1 Tax=Lentithecium fluviatile CBS 122367 TaxID=1168545 RepID=A0A6G1JMF7_9PLEO|nr:hypothetical protein K458DRAFT_411456 [Lentithecium fluviatile CBS 122367]